MNKYLTALLALGLVMITSTASAQEGHFPRWDEVAYGQRGITLPAGVLRLDATLGLAQVSIDRPPSPIVHSAASYLSFGAAIGVMENLELGVSGYRQGAMSTGVETGALPFQLTKHFNFGFVTPYGRFRIVHNPVFQLAAEASMILPTASNKDVPNRHHFGLMFGLPARLMLGHMAAIDAGLFFRTTFADPTTTDLIVPAGVVINVVPQFFLLGRTRFTYVDFNDRTLGLEFGGGFTLPSRGEPMLDLIATFGFPQLLTRGHGHGDIWHSSTDIWQLNFTAALRLGS